MLFDKLFAKKTPQPSQLKPAPKPKPEPTPKPEPPKPEPPKPKMTVRTCGRGEPANYKLARYSTLKLQWVSVDTDEQGEPKLVRTPAEKTQIFPLAQGFTAAGKHYAGLTQLYAQADKEKIWCRDIYGREVLYLADRFPCFDSDDYAYENRFYRWFFLRDGDKLTRVYYTDEDYRVYVTEDVENLEEKRWEEMKRYGYFRTASDPSGKDGKV